MAELSLLSPEWLLLLPLSIYAALRWGERFQTLFTPLPLIQVRHPLVEQLQQRSVLRTESSLSMRLLVAAALSLMVVAMAQPVRLVPLADDRSIPLDLVILVDTSITMSLKDYVVDGLAVDRLTVTKAILERFLRQFTGRKVALVVLGQPSAIWLPLTSERELASHLIGRLKIVLAGRHAGLGDALVEVAEKFGDNPESQGEQTTQRIILLVSDGVLPAGTLPPIEGGRQIQQRGMKLLALGVGSTAAEPTVSQQRGLIYEPLDLQILQQIVQPSGGAVLHAQSVDGAVAALDRALRQLLFSDHQILKDRQRELPLYPWLLVPALLLLLGLPLFARGAMLSREET